MRITFLYLLYFALICSQTKGSKILLAPWFAFYNSRLKSMLEVGEMLVEDGHGVTVLVPLFLKDKVSAKYKKIITFKMDGPVENDFDWSSAGNVFDQGQFSGQLLYNDWVNTVETPVCERFYSDKAAQKKLKSQHFDLLFTDHLHQIARVIIDFMDIPTLIYSTDGKSTDSNVFYPIIPSFVCPAYKRFCDGDKLNFWSRLKNFVSQASLDLYSFPAVAAPVDDLRRKYGINTTASARDSYKKRLVILNYHPLLMTPQPWMPHIIPIPGLFIQQPEPLNDQLRTFMDGAKQGAIVMALGTLVSALGKETEEAMAEVFSNLKQKVIWKYSGDPLQNRGRNTLLLEWLPVTDLLAHENTKVYITHAGTHSMYEAAYRGTPVLCVPFFLDQFTQCRLLTDRLEMGVTLEPEKITKESFEKALHQVLNDKKYLANAKRVQSIVLDQPMKSRDLFLHWVNFTIRHKGAHHLISEAPFELNLFQYLSLDVVAFLMGLFLMTIASIAIAIKKICLKYGDNEAKEKKLR